MSALSDIYTSIANAIRSKLGGSTTYKPSQMVSAISNINNKVYILWGVFKKSNAVLTIFLMTTQQFKQLDSLGSTPTVVYCLGGFEFEYRTSMSIGYYKLEETTRTIHNGEIRNQEFYKKNGTYYTRYRGIWGYSYIEVPLSVRTTYLRS